MAVADEPTIREVKPRRTGEEQLETHGRDELYCGGGVEMIDPDPGLGARIAQTRKDTPVSLRHWILPRAIFQKPTQDRDRARQPGGWIGRSTDRPFGPGARNVKVFGVLLAQ